MDLSHRLVHLGLTNNDTSDLRDLVGTRIRKYGGFCDSPACGKGTRLRSNSTAGVLVTTLRSANICPHCGYYLHWRPIEDKPTEHFYGI